MSFSPHLRSLEILQGWVLQGQKIFGFQHPANLNGKYKAKIEFLEGRSQKKGKGPGMVFAN